MLCLKSSILSKQQHLQYHIQKITSTGISTPTATPATLPASNSHGQHVSEPKVGYAVPNQEGGEGGGEGGLSHCLDSNTPSHFLQLGPPIALDSANSIRNNAYVSVSIVVF